MSLNHCLFVFVGAAHQRAIEGSPGRERASISWYAARLARRASESRILVNDVILLVAGRRSAATSFSGRLAYVSPAKLASTARRISLGLDSFLNELPYTKTIPSSQVTQDPKLTHFSNTFSSSWLRNATKASIQSCSSAKGQRRCNLRGQQTRGELNRDALTRTLVLESCEADHQRLLHLVDLGGQELLPTELNSCSWVGSPRPFSRSRAALPLDAWSSLYLAPRRARHRQAVSRW
jgi:hypothetical protein